MKEQLSVAQALGQAFAHLDAGRVEMAKKLARLLESQKPEPVGLAYLLGLIALEDGQGKKAAQHLARVLQRHGRLFHYTGMPNKVSSGRDLPAEVTRRLRNAGFSVEKNGDGLLAVKQRG